MPVSDCSTDQAQHTIRCLESLQWSDTFRSLENTTPKSFSELTSSIGSPYYVVWWFTTGVLSTIVHHIAFGHIEFHLPAICPLIRQCLNHSAALNDRLGLQLIRSATERVVGHGSLKGIESGFHFISPNSISNPYSYSYSYSWP